MGCIMNLLFDIFTWFGAILLVVFLGGFGIYMGIEAFKYYKSTPKPGDGDEMWLLLMITFVSMPAIGVACKLSPLIIELFPF